MQGAIQVLGFTFFTYNKSKQWNSAFGLATQTRHH